MRVLMSFTEGKSAAVRALLRRAVAEEYGLRGLRIEKTEHGKPYFPERPDIYFSLSHTDGAVLCAVSSSPVGCDVQIHRPVHERVPERVCAPEELRQMDFFDLWALKESWIKLRGLLDRPLREIVFTASDGIITAPPCVTDTAVPMPVFARVYGGLGDYSAAVCSAEDGIPDAIEIAEVP
ncbi:MAG: hypothetical protein J5569_04500 [Oscillospiraceae bacterium]|nr:hypothetical protein [Oscillospiraceae bacterium]